MTTKPAVLVALSLFTSTVLAGGSVELNGAQITALLSGKTTDCVKIKDGSTCATFFSKDGIVKRILDDDGARRDGKWYTDAQDLLCIHWDIKPKPLCLTVEDNGDNTYDLLKKGSHKSTITKFHNGNSRGL